MQLGAYLERKKLKNTLGAGEKEEQSWLGDGGDKEEKTVAICFTLKMSRENAEGGVEGGKRVEKKP